MIPNGEVVRWCECCQAAEALMKVHEAVPEEPDWVHNWCIKCTKNRVELGGCEHPELLLN